MSLIYGRPLLKFVQKSYINQAIWKSFMKMLLNNFIFIEAKQFSNIKNTPHCTDWKDQYSWHIHRLLDRPHVSHSIISVVEKKGYNGLNTQLVQYTQKRTQILKFSESGHMDQEERTV